MFGGRAAKGAEDENVLVGGVEHVEAYPVVIREALGNDADEELCSAVRSLAVAAKRRISETIFSKVGFSIPLFSIIIAIVEVRQI